MKTLEDLRHNSKLYKVFILWRCAGPTGNILPASGGHTDSLRAIKTGTQNAHEGTNVS